MSPSIQWLIYSSFTRKAASPQGLLLFLSLHTKYFIFEYIDLLHTISIICNWWIQPTLIVCHSVWLMEAIQGQIVFSLRICLLQWYVKLEYLPERCVIIKHNLWYWSKHRQQRFPSKVYVKIFRDRKCPWGTPTLTQDALLRLECHGEWILLLVFKECLHWFWQNKGPLDFLKIQYKCLCVYRDTCS